MPNVREETKRVELLDINDDTYDLEYNCIYETLLYGADADGNRGEWRTELVDFSLIAAYFNGKEIPLSKVPEVITRQGEREVER